MRAGALAPYERSLQDAGGLALVAESGSSIELDVGRWLAPADSADATVIDRCEGPVLDVGCGPGRFVHALAERGVAVLGLDIANTAIALTRRLDVPALLRSVFDPAPAEGRWPTVLLMDGNIGIGGDVTRLLLRVRRLLAPEGVLIVETALDPAADDRLSVRFSRNGESVGPAFEWAQVGATAMRRYALDAGYGVAEVWLAGGRTFMSLVR